MLTAAVETYTIFCVRNLPAWNLSFTSYNFFICVCTYVYIFIESLMLYTGGAGEQCRSPKVVSQPSRTAIVTLRARK